MKNWVLYFFSVIFFTTLLSLLAQIIPITPETPTILVKEGEAVYETDLENYTLRALVLQSRKCENYETKKALAVAIRSQAYYLSVNGLNHETFDVCICEGCCLPLGDIENCDQDLLKECMNAVSETQGEVVLYENKPALSLFCVCAGSGTSDCEDFPYLKGVGDELCSIHKTERDFSFSQIDFSLNDQNSCIVYDSWNKCVFAVADGKYITSDQLQSKLNLPSNEIVLNFQDGYLKAISYGAGKAYGLNLCGGDKLAMEGKDYKDILKKYFPELELINNN